VTHERPPALGRRVHAADSEGKTKVISVKIRLREVLMRTDSNCLRHRLPIVGRQDHSGGMFVRGTGGRSRSESVWISIALWLEILACRLETWRRLFQPLGFVAKLVGSLRELVPAHFQSAALFQEGSDLAQKVKNSFVHCAIPDAWADSRPPRNERAASSVREHRTWNGAPAFGSGASSLKAHGSRPSKNGAASFQTD
jgi:hypothetical protein